MAHAAAPNQGPNLQNLQSLVVGVGLGSKEKEKIATMVAATSRQTVCLLLHDKLGVVGGGRWAGPLGIDVTLLCFDPNGGQQFGVLARAALHGHKLGNHTGSTKALPHIVKRS